MQSLHEAQAPALGLPQIDAAALQNAATELSAFVQPNLNLGAKLFEDGHSAQPAYATAQLGLIATLSGIAPIAELLQATQARTAQAEARFAELEARIAETQAEFAVSLGALQLLKVMV